MSKFATCGVCGQLWDTEAPHDHDCPGSTDDRLDDLAEDLGTLRDRVVRLEQLSTVPTRVHGGVRWVTGTACDVARLLDGVLAEVFPAGGCGQPMLPEGETKRPNEHDHASGCPFDKARPDEIETEIRAIYDGWGESDDSVDDLVKRLAYLVRGAETRGRAKMREEAAMECKATGFVWSGTTVAEILYRRILALP